MSSSAMTNGQIIVVSSSVPDEDVSSSMMTSGQIRWCVVSSSVMTNWQMRGCGVSLSMMTSGLMFDVEHFVVSSSHLSSRTASCSKFWVLCCDSVL